MIRSLLCATVMRVSNLLLLSVMSLACSALAGTMDSGRNAPHISFAGKTVTVTGLPPGRRAVVFGAARVPLGRSYQMDRWSGITAADSTGLLSFQASRDIPANSIWCVVDMTTGEYTVASPHTDGLRITPFLPNAFRKGTTADEFAFNHPFLDVLYVNPGEGAWVGALADGSATDRDGPNGIIVVSLSDLTPLGSATKAKNFAPGGILVAVDVLRSEVAVIRLDSATLTAGGPR